MFKSLKLYVNQEVGLEELVSSLIEFGYYRHEQVLEEGDFSRRGEVVDIYPATFECPIRIVTNINKIESIVSIDATHNRVIWRHNLVIILPWQKRYHARITTFAQERPLNLFVELKRNDLVVHIRHGIGRYLGIEKITTAQGEKDHFVIEYAKKEKLFVPAGEAHLIQKYIGLKGNGRPRINRLGTNEWASLKNRVKCGIRIIALGMLRAHVERLLARGFAFSKDTQWQSEFEKTFPYTETPDQAKALAEVKQDMESIHPMDRLLCGDVGYGKTEVAMRVAFKAVMDNAQVAMLVPTTILAQQHYQNFIQRLRDFPVNVQMLSRFRSGSEQKKIIERIRNGKVDIVIGTHRLLSNDISFRNLRLLIIDEEQRFGVRDKEKIKLLRINVDILTLTATPIPRTLYMGLMGIKDISAINTPPQNRMSVATYVLEYDEDVIAQAIRKEMGRQGQLFFVHNQVYDIEEICERVSRFAGPDVKVACVHGQMPENELERIMLDFLQKRVDCLVCTTIIESGIDVPLANTLIVNNAHMFGLADLHQLRGRVGRFNRRAYAYFLFPRHTAVAAEAKARLEAIKAYSELGSGFKIAMEDLELRGAGDLLGHKQHGYIQAVGFDLYCRLLKETALLLKKTNVVLSQDEWK
jgi:transcription-repair coupling factor (superfamily II helicase)